MVTDKCSVTTCSKDVIHRALDDGKYFILFSAGSVIEKPSYFWGPAPTVMLPPMLVLSAISALRSQRLGMMQRPDLELSNAYNKKSWIIGWMCWDLLAYLLAAWQATRWSLQGRGPTMLSCKPPAARWLRVEWEQMQQENWNGKKLVTIDIFHLFFDVNRNKKTVQFQRW